MSTDSMSPPPHDPTNTEPTSGDATPVSGGAAPEQPAKRGPGRPGGVGEKIFEQVEALVGDQGLSRTEAFQRISEESGRRSGTVAANYYRIARKRKGDDSSTRRRGRPRGRRRGGASGATASAALARAQEALEELSGVVRAQEKELAELREQSAQLDKVRRLMDENVS